MLQLEQNIIDITFKIQNEFSELSKYISEIPQNNSEDEQINLKSLEDYNNSLQDILEKYGNTHGKGWNEKDFKNIKIDVEASDKMTDNEKDAFVKNYFEKHSA